MFTIFRNSELTNIENFNNLSYVGDDFELKSNSELTNIGDFNNLCTVVRDFEISNNFELKNIGNFNNLCSIGRDFNFSRNFILTDIGNFNNLCSIGRDLIFSQNFDLAACCTFKHILDSGSISGSIMISNNEDGCNSQADIDAACGVVDPIPTSCVDPICITLSSCGKGTLSTCALLDGPCCSFTPTIDGFTIEDGKFDFSCDDVGMHTATITDALGADFCTVQIEIKAEPFDFDITGDTQLFCSGTPTTLSTTTGSSFLWSTGETAPSITVTPTETTTYTVAVSDTKGGCTVEKSVEVVVGDCVPIPTMGQWGLICLSLLLMIFGLVAIKEKELVIG